MNPTPNAPMTDDELGAALGASVRNRVDDVPTITPSFDGVERRARQITQRRRAVAGLAVGALAVFGGLGATALLGDDEGADELDVFTPTQPEPAVVEEEDDEPTVEPDAEGDDPAEAVTPDPEPEADDTEESDDIGDAVADEEPVVVLTDWFDPAVLGIVSIESDASIGGGPLTVPLVGRDADDVVWVATPAGNEQVGLGDIWQATGVRRVEYLVDPDDPTNRNWVFDMGEMIIHVDPDQGARVVADAAYLVGADLVLGRPTAFVADLPIAAGGAVEIGGVYRIDLLTGERVDVLVGLAMNDALVYDVMAHGDVTFIEMGGAEGISLLLGVDDPANEPTGFEGATMATLSADGSTLYWMVDLGPDIDLRPQMELHIADLASGGGPTVIPVTLPTAEIALEYDLEDTGDGLLLTRSYSMGFVDGRERLGYGVPVLIDPATGDWEFVDIPEGDWNVVG